MKNEFKNYNVQIFGEEYSLLSDEPENQVVAVAELVNQSMIEVQEATSFKEPKKIAVLAALRLASRLLESEEQLADCSEKATNIVNYLEKELQ